MMGRMRGISVFIIASLLAAPCAAQNSADTFSDREDGAKVHVSGFVCPQRISDFERDAVGEYDLDRNQDFCAYASRDGVYGTITLQPLNGGYDPKASLAPEFNEQESTGGKRIDERPVRLSGSPVSLYTRTYRTARAEALEYRILFAGAALKTWVVEA